MSVNTSDERVKTRLSRFLTQIESQIEYWESAQVTTRSTSERHLAERHLKHLQTLFDRLIAGLDSDD